MSLDSLAVATVNEHAQIEALEPESVLVKARVEGWIIGLTGPDKKKNRASNSRRRC